MRIISFLIIFLILPLTAYSQKDSNKAEVDSLYLKLQDVLSLTVKNNFEDAISITVTAINKSKELKNDTLIGIGYTTMGIINSHLGKFKESIENHRIAEKLFIKAKNYRYLGSSYNNIAVSFYDNKKEIDSAIVYFKKALQNYKLANDGGRMSFAYFNLGEMYRKTSELDTSIEYLNLAIKYAKKYNKKYPLSYSYYEFSELYFGKDDFNKASMYADLSEEIAVKNNYDDLLLNLYYLKGKIYKEKKEYQNAFKYLEKHLFILKDLHENVRSKITQETAVKFRLEESAKALEVAKIKNEQNELSLKKSQKLIILSVSLVAFFLLLIIMFYRNSKLKKENNLLLMNKNKELRELQLQTELNFLKTQIQPHFFFNTLNNLYSLIIEGSPKAKDVVLKLSELMQYALYKSNKGKIALWDEIHNIHNYLELESLRHGEQVHPTIKIENNLDDLKVPPMLYIQFVENCFKHGDLSDNKFKLFITFKKSDSNLIFKIKNTFDPEEKNKKDKTIGGIGIENVKRRLALMYKNNYTLKITKENRIFSVYLKIPV